MRYTLCAQAVILFSWSYKDIVIWFCWDDREKIDIWWLCGCGNIIIFTSFIPLCMPKLTESTSSISYNLYNEFT